MRNPFPPHDFCNFWYIGSPFLIRLNQKVLPKLGRNHAPRQKICVLWFYGLIEEKGFGGRRVGTHQCRRGELGLEQYACLSARRYHIHLRHISDLSLIFSMRAIIFIASYHLFFRLVEILAKVQHMIKLNKYVRVIYQFSDFWKRPLWKQDFRYWSSLNAFYIRQR